jgi:RimJ/RimL family protein N-acetyltransferase
MNAETPDPDRVTVRELRPDEGALLDTVMAGMSANSRYLRFHTPISELTPRLRHALLDVDGFDHLALVAEAEPGGAVGIARILRNRRRRDEGEIAVAVVDAWHRRGVGRHLVTAVTEHARRHGVRRITARVLPENTAALNLFRSVFPLALTSRDADSLVLVGLVGDPRGWADWAITDEDVLADLGA